MNKTKHTSISTSTHVMGPDPDAISVRQYDGEDDTKETIYVTLANEPNRIVVSFDTWNDAYLWQNAVRNALIAHRDA